MNAAFYSDKALFTEPVFPDPADPSRQRPGGEGTRQAAVGALAGRPRTGERAKKKATATGGNFGVLLSPPISRAIGGATGAGGAEPKLLHRTGPPPPEPCAAWPDPVTPVADGRRPPQPRAL